MVVSLYIYEAGIIPVRMGVMDEEEEDEHVFCRGKRSKPMKTEYWPAIFVLLF